METKTWFITGCSSGFGAALAAAALAAGHHVVATARRVETLADLASHAHCLTLAYDVTATDATTALQSALAFTGRLDVVVNNAGAGLLGALEELTPAEIEACMAVNFYGPLRIMQAAAPIFRQQNGGHLINISAAAAIANYPGFSVYGAAKAALEYASESYRAELAPAHVKVTLVQPGPFRTHFTGKSLHRAATTLTAYDGTSGKFGALIRSIDGKQPGDPAKAAQAILRAAEMDAPPLRLVLGTYATKKARSTAENRIKELDATSALTSGTEFTS